MAAATRRRSRRSPAWRPPRSTNNRADSPYTFAVGSSLAAPQQLPPILNRWHTLMLDLRYFLRCNIAAGFMYSYERYTVSDFALGSQIEDQVILPGIVLLGYGNRPYTANAFWVRMMHIF
jgi:hypothetical protein